MLEKQFKAKLQSHSETEHVNTVLDKIENGEGNFWSLVHQPFKKNQLTRCMVKNLIKIARIRYQANLPGLAIKLNVCSENYQNNQAEIKNFISFKNFLYKTVKISKTN